jgi:hypothetical protein
MLKTFIATEGVQDSSRYTVAIGNYVFDENVIAVDLPGPSYEFLDINYWQGNPFFKMPIGVKFRESIVIQLLVPEKIDGELFKFINEYTRAFFFMNNGGSFFYGGTIPADAGSFSAIRTGNAPGVRIRITAYNRVNDDPVRTYNYNNCFLEKILPLRFESGKPDPQTLTMSFVVSSMGNDSN